MQSLHDILRTLLLLLVPLSFLATTYLHLYPFFHGCAFPLPESTALPTTTTLHQHTGQEQDASFTTATTAPFRLLILADPQLEGDTSLPFPEFQLPARLARHRLTLATQLRQLLITNTTNATDSTNATNATNVTNLNVMETEAANTTATGTTTMTSVTSRLVRLGMTLGRVVAELVLEDVPRALGSGRKRLDLWGNDYYLGHIYRVLDWWLQPTHVVVLGDLLGSQWIGAEEFGRRAGRYWTRVFRGAERVREDTVTTMPMPVTWAEGDEQEVEDSVRTTTVRETLAEGVWRRRLINVAGNHDIGYAGEVTAERMERFEREFGPANWDIEFEHPVSDPRYKGPTPKLHVVVLNDMMLDVPAYDERIQKGTYDFLNSVIERSPPVEDRSHFTILLTHVPLHKEEGLCTDAPYFTYHEEDNDEQYWKNGSLREQNLLSDWASRGVVLEGLFGLTGELAAPAAGHGRNGIILNGHDHTGCDVVHYVNRSVEFRKGTEEDTGPVWSWNWAVHRLGRGSESAEAFIQREGGPPHVREATLRSMMGMYGGNAGMLSVWFDARLGEWRYGIETCMLGKTPVWWTVNVMALITLAFLTAMPFIPRDTAGVSTGEKDQAKLIEKEDGNCNIKGQEPITNDTSTRPKKRSMKKE